jgi:isoquinoline 1-oxidoreductase beta subunit
MGTLKTLTRRTFLVSSAAIAGGVAFGTYYVAKDPANPLK